MNAKTARKLRKHIQLLPLEKRDEAYKALKSLSNKGFIKFDNNEGDTK